MYWNHILKKQSNFTWPLATRPQFHQCSTHSFSDRISRKRKKNQLGQHNIFTHLGSACVKAVCRMLMKLTPGVNFINIFEQLFCTKVFSQLLSHNSFYVKRILAQKLLEKCLCNWLQVRMGTLINLAWFWHHFHLV